MKRLLASAIFTAALAFPALAGPLHTGQVIDVTGYSLPDPAGFGSVTTLGYSYYTAPITLTLSDGSTVTVYCADLNHVLHTGQYIVATLEQSGTGTALPPDLSNHLGRIAALGLDALANGQGARAAAAQAVIWSLEYAVGQTFADPVGAVAQEASALAGLLAGFPSGGPRAIALIPYKQGWSEDPRASQQMILGLAAVPEPYSLGLLGAGLVALGMVRRRAA